MESTKEQDIKWYKKPFSMAQGTLSARPFLSFLIILALFISLMVAGKAINKPKSDNAKVEKIIKEVSVYSATNTPKVEVQATVKKTGIVTIYAQASGIVQQIYKKEGDKINKGNNIAWISSSYNAGTISSVNRQQAQENYQFNKDNLSTQLDTIQKQRNSTLENRENIEQLRQITDKSVQETQDLLNLNNSQYQNVVNTINQLEQNNADGSQNATISQLKAQQSQLSAGINQLQQAQRNAQYQRDIEKPPTKLADLQRDIALQQLSIQEKSLQLQLDVSKFNFQLAQISESFNYPASPINGMIERIAVVPGQVVNPGEVIAVVTSPQNSATLEALVPEQIAIKISRTNSSVLHLANSSVELMPAYVSSQPTSGQMYSVKYQLPAQQTDKVSNSAFARIEIPLDIHNEAAPTLYLPIDSIFQTQDGAYVYITQKKDSAYVATSKKITLGELSGKFVEVKSGLEKNDNVILDRNILEGDLLAIKQ